MPTACGWTRCRRFSTSLRGTFWPTSQTAAHEEGAARNVRVHAIAETDQNDVRLQHLQDRGGYGLDAVWSDDFHHAVHALLTGERQGYYEDFGSPEQVAKAFNEVFVRDGGYSRFLRRRHGAPAGDIDRGRFVVCMQNHDQIGNRAVGDRLCTLLPPAAQRLAAALLMLSPCTPMIFMGEEYGETRPFPFFCSFGDTKLAEAVRRGRRAEFPEMNDSDFPDPLAEATFQNAKLAWDWPDGSSQSGMRRLYGALIAARRQWPALQDRVHTSARCDSACDERLLVLERGGAAGIVALANCSDKPCSAVRINLADRVLLLSTADKQFGGPRGASDAHLTLLPYELQVYGTPN